MAADSACTDSGMFIGTVQKLAKHPDGMLVGFAGLISAGSVFLRWIEAGMPEPLELQDTDFYALAVTRNGVIWKVDHRMVFCQLAAAYTAEGSGMKIAMGAMAAGASAKRAAEIACELDQSCRLPVTTLRLGK